MMPVYPLVIPEWNGEPIVPKKYLDHLMFNGVRRICTTEGTSTFWKYTQDQLFDFHCELSLYLGKTIELIIGLKEDTQRNLMETLNDYSIHFGRKEKNIKFLLLYPDRFYDQTDVDDIIDFFEPIFRNFSHLDIFIHAKPLRSGHGLKWEDFSQSALSSLAYLGMRGFKEESIHFENTRQIVQFTNSYVKAENIIVAGGDIKKNLDLHLEGLKTNFLTGLGSIHPKIDNDFAEWIQMDELDEAIYIIQNEWMEAQYFVRQMGWHRFLFTSLVVCGMIDKEVDENGSIDNRYTPDGAAGLKEMWKRFGVIQ